MTWKPLTHDQQALRGCWEAEVVTRLRSNYSRAPFRAKTPAGKHRCGRCLKARAATWHHWVPQSAIRAEVQGDGAKYVLADERNLTPMCFDCHMAGEARAGTRCFTADEIPASAWEFARELGEWAVIRLEKYPA